MVFWNCSAKNAPFLLQKCVLVMPNFHAHAVACSIGAWRLGWLLRYVTQIYYWCYYTTRNEKICKKIFGISLCWHWCGACYRTPLRPMALFLMLLKRIQLPIFSNDLLARDQNHEKKHHRPWSIASVFKVSCSMGARIEEIKEEKFESCQKGKHPSYVNQWCF